MGLPRDLETEVPCHRFCPAALDDFPSGDAHVKGGGVGDEQRDIEKEKRDGMKMYRQTERQM